MPKLKTKILRVRKGKDSPWQDIPAIGGLTDEEIIEYMVETDTILTVTEEDGTLLCDENGDVLMW